MDQRCCQTPFVTSFIDYELAFGSVDRKALAKFLSLYGIPDKYIEVTALCTKKTLLWLK